MRVRSKWSKLLVARGALALIVAGGVALAQPGDGADQGIGSSAIRPRSSGPGSTPTAKRGPKRSPWT